MESKFQFTLTHLFLLFFVVMGVIKFFLNPAASYASSAPIIALEKFTGISQVIYDVEYGPQSSSLLKDYEIDFSAQFLKSFQGFLRENKKITLQFARNAKIEPGSKFLLIGSVLTIRDEKIGERNIKVGALSLSLRKNDEEELIIKPVTFPFIVPESKQELERKLEAGISYLTSFLPSYIACANDVTSCSNLEQPIYVQGEKK